MTTPPEPTDRYNQLRAIMARMGLVSSQEALCDQATFDAIGPEGRAHTDPAVRWRIQPLVPTGQVIFIPLCLGTGKPKTSCLCESHFQVQWRSRPSYE